ncbi:MAG: SDR family oxidoreductase [Rhodospirillaceae bacterium]|nr:SDR family oxidoreductase [Rhodospirillaceae bacterium]
MASFAAVYSGIGTQWKAMGRDLMEDAAFAEGLRDFDRAFRAVSGWSVEAWLYEEEGDVAPAFRGHPCSAGVCFGLTGLLRAKGVEPALYLGHSGGEVAAAWAAGALSTEQAARIVNAHSNVLRLAGGKGAMLHLGLPGPDRDALLDRFRGRVQVAVFNSPSSTVCSGEKPFLEELARQAEELEPGSSRFLGVDVPFHAREIDPFLDGFVRDLGDFRPIEPQAPIVSSLHGEEADVAGRLDFGPDYWVRHIREPVRFTDAVGAALARGVRHFVEIAPHAALQAALADTAALHGVILESTALMVRQEKGQDSVHAALQTIAGWDGVTGTERLTERARRMADLPPARRRQAMEDMVREAFGAAADGPAPDSSLRDTPFLALGLTSLGAMRLARELSGALGLNVPVSAIFSHATLRSLAGHLEERIAAGGGQAASALDPRPKAPAWTGDEPIAVVGASCLLPGGIEDLDGYWRFLAEGGDAVVPIPADRWDRERYYDESREAPGKMYTREAAFVTAPLDRFDGFFFNISAKEARQLDPQQRLLLELSWRAFEQAGIDPTLWWGRAAGVFLGMTNTEYAHAHRESYRRELIDAYSLTGTTLSGACGRISYFFGFEGPCWSVDTACSSGIVALHNACVSLRRGESALALAGAVTLMLTPDLHICFTKLGAVSRDGRSKAFDDGADGYGRGEGGAVVLLKRLADAERDGDQILGVIRGSAINQDGRSNGLTAPNGRAQETVIAQALADAGRSPLDVSYVEAHGTGTALGDSIELDALAAAYCSGRTRDDPLRIGSVKANIGHLEPAAAFASLLKLLLCFRHRAIPANIHVKTPNTRFDFASRPLEVPTALTPWDHDGRLCAGMSAFGFSGVNGHVIVEEYTPAMPAQDSDGQTAPALLFLPLSAKTPEALRALADAVAARLETLNASDAAALCRFMATTRPAFPVRLYGVGGSAAALAAALRAAQPRTAPAASEPALLFTGQGSQYPDMGRTLYAHYPVFRDALDRCFAILSGFGLDGRALLFGGRAAEELEDTALAQPLIASLSYAVWTLWRSFGVDFSAACGHSIGEYPAAVAAGVMDLEDMLALTVARGRAMRDAPEGGMAAAFADRSALTPVLDAHPSVVVAAVNAPDMITLAGPDADLERVRAVLERQGITVKPLAVSRAFHSPAMAGAAERFRAALQGVSLNRPRTMSLVSTVSGVVEDEAWATPEYWVGQILAPVRFAAALQTLAGFSAQAVEAGPSSALSGLARRNGKALTAVPSLVPGRDGLDSLFAAVGHLFCQGLNIDFSAVLSFYPRCHADAPGYPFQRESHWMPVVVDPPALAAGTAAGGAGERQISPALGRTALFSSRFDGHAPFFVQEHVIFDKAISPAAGHMAMLLAAARALWGEVPCVLLGVDFLAPLVVEPDAPRLVQVIIDDPGQDESPFRLMSVALAADGSADGDAEWLLHCQGSLSSKVGAPPADQAADAGLEPPVSFGPVMEQDAFYRRFLGRGYAVGPGFQRIEAIRAAQGRAACRVAVRRGEAGEDGHVLYPGALDSILQTILPPYLIDLESVMADAESLLIPLHVDRLTLWRTPPETVLCVSEARKGQGDSVLEGTTLARDAAGRAVLELAGCLFRMTDYATLYRGLRRDPAMLLYTPAWVAAEPAPAIDGDVFLWPVGDGAIPAALAGLPRCAAADLDGMAARGRAAQILLLHHPKDAPFDPQSEIADAGRLLRIFQTVASSAAKVRLHLVTHGLAPAGESGALGLSGASLPGLAASIALEHPGLLASVVDLPIQPEDEDYRQLTRLCLSFAETPAEPALRALRRGRLWACKLTPVSKSARVRTLDLSGAHFISGGTGSLGLKTALRLAEAGAGCVGLFSRSGVLPESAQGVAAAIQAAGCALVLLKGDVTKEADVAAALTELRAQGLPLRGVFHTAGILDDGVFDGLTEERLRRVMDPKVSGAWILDRLTGDDPLAFFVCYSSAGSLIGSPAQANYNAANHFLNALCRKRRADGKAAAAPCFGPWSDGGMAANGRVRDNLLRQGILPLDGDDALDGLFAGLQRDEPVFGVMDMRWARFGGSRTLEPDGVFSLLPVQGRDAAGQNSARADDDPFAGVVRADGTLDPEKTLTGLCRVAAGMLGQTDPGRIAPDKPLQDYGFDSLMAVEFRTIVGKSLNMAIPVSITFEYPTVALMCGWLCGQRGGDGAKAPAPSVPPPAIREDDAVIQDLLADIDSLLD